MPRGLSQAPPLFSDVVGQNHLVINKDLAMLYGDQKLVSDPVGYQAAVLADSPDAYWPMCEPADKSRGVSFLGADCYATVASVTLGQYTSGSMTAECWCNPSFLNANARALVGTNNNSSGWRVDATSTALRYTRANGVATTTSFTTTLVVGTRIHVAITYDGTNVRFYINGALVSGPTANARSVTTANPLRVGQRADDGITLSQWIGAIGHVAIYPSALAVARILAHYNAGA